MFKVIALATVSVANANKVHKYLAEDNYMCELYNKVFEYSRDGKYDGMEAIYKQFFLSPLQ